MGIKSKEEEIFKKMRKLNPDTVIDGVVDETQFSDARYKIVYILKEVNGGKKWDLREFLYNRGRKQTWNNIARWTEGILNLENEISWDILKSNNELRRCKELKKIAVVNLKKTSGGHTSNENEIYREAFNYGDIVKQQINLYKPDFIICCGTKKAFVDVCYKNVSVEWKMTFRGVWYFYYDDCVVISFSHPEARINDAFLYYSLIDAVREIKGQKTLLNEPFSFKHDK